MEEKKYVYWGKNKVPAVEIECDNCGKKYLTSKGNLKRCKKHFCSKECNTYNRTGKWFECSNKDCDKEIYRKRTEINKSKSGMYFCSRSCRAKTINLGVRRHGKAALVFRCINCQNEFSKSHYNARLCKNLYCSKKCQMDYQQKDFIKKWLCGEESGTCGDGVSQRIRRYLFEQRGQKCERCGWKEVNEYTGNVPVHIDHMDGNWENNRPENLRILCPNCHSLTENYGSRNRGNGRDYRKIYRERMKKEAIIK